MSPADDVSIPPRPATGCVDKFGEGFVWDAWYVAGLSPDLKAGKAEQHVYLGELILLGRTRAGQVYPIRDICSTAPPPCRRARSAPRSTGPTASNAPITLAVLPGRGLQGDPVPDR